MEEGKKNTGKFNLFQLDNDVSKFWTCVSGFHFQRAVGGLHTSVLLAYPSPLCCIYLGNISADSVLLAVSPHTVARKFQSGQEKVFFSVIFAGVHFFLTHNL